ncbi:Pyruvate kinase, barrel [Ostreococcus tauri]|uniref:Pyruvate kinase n=1 Tax=Ostreococcus tauri TaxID=70448 RepID=A0A096P7T8_OSTTA|nr:Pyruvate kinase, barrel [Ostreococcus tauri]CEG00276.1 Pyruvate kinase, barrel [Ostreococcus tauri]|eukprot:XP_003083494.2 Pyruvate kinase, barrel [Ostreococcus tauri]
MGLTRQGTRHGSYVDLTQGAGSMTKSILDNGGIAQDGSFKSKIICTLGPVSRTVEILENMLRAGMSIARFNFSHGSHEYHQETLDNLRRACANTGIHCGVLLDTKGPEIRTGMLACGGPVMLEAGNEITLTTDYDFKGSAEKIAVSYPDLAKDVKPGSKILCADGSVTFTVLECDVAKGEVRCKLENSAKLGERKNMNLPGVVVNLPTITEKDRHDLIEWGVKNQVDFIAASFVRKGSDVEYIRSVLGDFASKVSIISKVENMEGLDNFEDIVEASDGVMVARGDLGMEIRMEQIFLAQKRMIKRCNIAGKPVVTATQMLESMTGAPRPTRAEATDVANAILDGTDAVMLSGETAAGSYPLDAVKCMASICREAEAYVDNLATYFTILEQQPMPMSTVESLASSAVRTAQKVDAAAIITLSKSGDTARLIAKYRPAAPIVAVAYASVENPGQIARKFLMSRGIVPVIQPQEWAEGSDIVPQAVMRNTILYARDSLKIVKPGDKIVGVHRLLGEAILKVVEVPDGDSF